MTNNQPRSKILILVIGILLIANIILLFCLLHRPDDRRNDHKGPMTAYLKNEIGFSAQQMSSYDSIKNQHRRDVKKFFDVIKNKKEDEFRQLGLNHFNDSSIIRAANYSAGQQSELEKNMLYHLKDIRNICTAEQKAKFDTGFYKTMVRSRNDDKAKD